MKLQDIVTVEEWTGKRWEERQGVVEQILKRNVYVNIGARNGWAHYVINFRRKDGSAVRDLTFRLLKQGAKTQ